LARTPIPQGVVFDCPNCKGRAIGIPVLRKLVPENLVKDLWLRARQDEASPGAECPICHQAMAEVLVPAAAGTVALDVCAACQFVWLDPMESEQLPSIRREPSLRERLPEKAREQIALMQLKTLEAKERGTGFGEESPDEEWKWIPAMFGLPVEFDVNPIRFWPWLTWGLAAAMALVYALTAWNLQPIVDDLGLVPANLAGMGA
jgi:Zn-finger nucleic acid-binding protein